MTQNAKVGNLNETVMRYPWIDESLLSMFFTPDHLAQLEKNSGNSIQTAIVPEIGKCYALAIESPKTAFGLWRFRTARYFAFNIMGADAIHTGFSPTPNADGEFGWKKTWSRVWVDLGGIAPEALGFIRKPPTTFGPDVKDIIVTLDSNRIQTLAAQVALNWGGSQPVYIYDQSGAQPFIAKRYNGFQAKWYQSSLKEKYHYFSLRMKKDEA